MKIRWFDQEAIDREPITILEEMPAFLNVLHRVENDLHSLLTQGIDTAKRKRAAHLMMLGNHVYFMAYRALMDHLLYSQTIVHIRSISQDDLSALTPQGETALKKFMERYSAISNKQYDPFYEAMEQVQTRIWEMLATEKIDALIDAADLSVSQKRESLDRLITYMQDLNANNKTLMTTPFISKNHLLIREALEYKEKPTGVFQSVQGDPSLHEDIDEAQDSILTLLHYLYAKKKALEEENPVV